MKANTSCSSKLIALVKSLKFIFSGQFLFYFLYSLDYPRLTVSFALATIFRPEACFSDVPISHFLGAGMHFFFFFFLTIGKLF